MWVGHGLDMGRMWVRHGSDVGRMWVGSWKGWRRGWDMGRQRAMNFWPRAGGERCGERCDRGGAESRGCDMAKGNKFMAKGRRREEGER